MADRDVKGTEAMYTDEEIIKGAGAFEHAMRSQSSIPGITSRISAPVAVGVLSAAMRSGLPVSRMERMIDQEFASCAQLMKRILDMYEGDDWDIHLWSALPTGRYKLCTDLARPNLATWRYDRNDRSRDD